MRFPIDTRPMATPGHTVTRACSLVAAIVIVGMLGSIAAASDQAPAPQEDLEAQVNNESAQLERLKEQLDALERISTPNPVSPTPTATPSKSEPKLKPVKTTEIPSVPLPGAEEAFADTLFALGEYERALTVYQQIIDTKPPEKTASWICMQIGNCARRQGDFTAALSAYDTVMTEMPESFWAEEAAWWTDEIKWRLLWKQVLNPEPLEPASNAP